MALAFLFREFSFGRPVVLLSGCLIFVLLSTSRLVTRALERRLARHGIGLRRVLLVGTGPLAKRLREEIETWPVGYEVVGFVSDGEPATAVPSEDILGPVSQLGEQIRALQVQDVFVASRGMRLHEDLNLLAEHERWGVNFHVVSEELEPFARHVRLDRVVELPLLQLPYGEANSWYEWSKRIFDVVAASAALICCVPVYAAIAVGVKLESPGRALFTQQRVGRAWLLFTMYKFRTMREDAGEDAVSPNDLHDPRVTRFGRWLRRWSLDELPQLVNVLKGDMSLVGPRPEMPFLVKEYEPWQTRRLSVRPGLTGLWQVMGRKELPLHRNIEYDLYYVRHQGWLIDATILARTIPAVLFRRGAF